MLQSAGRAVLFPFTRSATGAAFRRAYAIGTSSSDSHDDFKPKYKEEPAQDPTDTIKKDIAENDVFIYMKGVPSQPQCGFSNMACRILDAYGVKYGSRNVLADQGIREGVKKFSNWPTIPQVFINHEFVGGSDILYDLHEKGELFKLLEPIRNVQQQASK